VTQNTTLRTLVERELAARNTTFEAYIEAARTEGKSINQAAASLVQLTGIPISRRTVYYWVENLGVSA